MLNDLSVVVFVCLGIQKVGVWQRVAYSLSSYLCKIVMCRTEIHTKNDGTSGNGVATTTSSSLQHSIQ